MRVQSKQLIPRKYAFLTKHSRSTFIIPYTYNSSSSFSIKLRYKHNFIGASIHDMWFADLPSVSGNPRIDFNTSIEQIYHSGGASSYMTCDKNYVYIYFTWTGGGTGTYHRYFHVKLYDDEFLADAVVGTPWRTTPPVGK